jgi:hypothetical protein
MSTATSIARRRAVPYWDAVSFVCLSVSCLALALGALNLGDGLMSPEVETGTSLIDTASGVRVAELAVAGAGERAGLEPGDRILTLDGEPVAGALQTADHLWKSSPQAPVLLEILREGRKLELSYAPSQRGRDLHPRLYLWLVGLAFLVSGTLLILQRRRAGLLPYYLLSLTAWALLAFSHTGRASALDWTIYWLDTAARCLLPALAVHCALLYPRPLVSRRARVALAGLAYGGAALLLGCALWLVGAGAAYRFTDPVAALEACDRLQLLYLALGLGAAAVALALHRLHHQDRLALRQLKWVEWGTAVALAPFIIFYLLPAGLGLEVGPWHSLALLPLGLLPVTCSVALARRRLSDLEVLLKRGVVLAANSLVVAACYLAFLFVLRATLGKWAALPNKVPMLLAVIAAAALYPGLRERINARVDRLFYLDKYDYRKTLIQFSRELNSERELPAVLERFLERIVQTLEVARAAVFLSDVSGEFTVRAESPPREEPLRLRLGGRSPLAALLQGSDHLPLVEAEAPAAAVEWAAAGFEYLLPLKVKGEIVALLAVGARTGGSSLTREDLQLLVTVSGHAAMAVEGARLYSEIKRKVDEVEKLRALSDGILQSSRIGILVVAPGGDIYCANEAAQRLLGAPLAGARAQEHLPRPILDLLAAEGSGASDGVRRLYRLPVEVGRGRRVINATAAPLQLPEVGSGASVLTLDDVTERIELEEKLLQNERLASIGLLAAGVAHEVNTPLTGICSYIQMLLSDMEASDTRATVLRKVESQAFRASDIVNSLLNFARGGDQAFAPTDLNSAVEEAIALFEPHLHNTRIQIERDLAPALPPVWGIRREIQQVVVNLLLNARDAMPRGGRIRLSTRQTPAGVEMQIADTGRGIPPEHLQRIYDPFFTTKGVGKGTGLGLSVTYGIVRKHSGSIDVHSAPDSGTIFTISLPSGEETARVVTH